MSVDETTIYELMRCINDLKSELKKLQEELKDTRKAINENTFELLKKN